jgi:hypothetical protein
MRHFGTEEDSGPDLADLMMFQIGTGSRGDVTILPTLVINNVQYRGLCSAPM